MFSKKRSKQEIFPNCSICNWKILIKIYKKENDFINKNSLEGDQVPMVFCSAQGYQPGSAVYNSLVCQNLFKEKINNNE